MTREGVRETIVERKRLVAAIAAVVAIGCLAPAAAAQGSRRFATPNEAGTAYTIDYAALARADDLTNAQRYQVARALRNGEGHVAAAGVESIDFQLVPPGIKGDGKCE